MPTEADDEIHYDPSLNQGAKSISLDPATPAGDPNAKTLLHLMFWALHTNDGRVFFRQHKWRPGTGLTPSDRDEIIKKAKEYGVLREDLHAAIVDAHVAGEQFAEMYRNRNFGPERKTYEAVYLQKMAFITWSLWEDTKGHEYSLGW